MGHNALLLRQIARNLLEPPTIEFALFEWLGGSTEITIYQILFKLG